jgi:hypothetical protein
LYNQRPWVERLLYQITGTAQRMATRCIISEAAWLTIYRGFEGSIVGASTVVATAKMHAIGQRSFNLKQFIITPSMFATAANVRPATLRTSCSSS